MSPSPDLAGFRDAAVRMRAEMGTDVPFFTRVEGTYPEGTAIDPENGKPFDPTVAPVGSAWGSAVVRAGVYTENVPGSREDDVARIAAGWFEDSNIVLDVDPDDYVTVEDATEVEYSDRRYEVSDVDGSEIDNVEHRKLIFARRK